MAKTHPLGFRVEPNIKESLERAAKADGRSVSNLIERILSAWLDERGLLLPPNHGGAQAASSPENGTRHND